MKTEDVRKIEIENERVEDFTETHISWLLFTEDYVYKIKKPVKYSFLDFSDLDKRQHYCAEELRLNRRLTELIYLDIAPVYQKDGDYWMGSGIGAEVCDYAVKLKRLDRDHQMHIMLEQGEVNSSHIESIVDELVPFHRHAEVIRKPFKARGLQEKFEDLQSAASLIDQHIDGAASFISDIIERSADFLQSHENYFQLRVKKQLQRDVHGDLHSRNIFLLDKPIIFDCIEFNDDFRQIDLLNELAFFCMDLEAFDENELSDHFIEYYRSQFPEVFATQKAEEQFIYYKLYRANVRAKVEAFKVEQIEDEEEIQVLMDEVKVYLELMEEYAGEVFG